ncbi:MAG: hypothetical protein QNK37_35590 [Acidobacteriota bacterium]|nr:hypothetical protein [Acidobacteriota bacterium]
MQTVHTRQKQDTPVKAEPLPAPALSEPPPQPADKPLPTTVQAGVATPTEQPRYEPGPAPTPPVIPAQPQARAVQPGNAHQQPAEPRVHIGRVDVVVLAPQTRPNPAPSSGPSPGFASRNYLRSL